MAMIPSCPGRLAHCHSTPTPRVPGTEDMDDQGAGSGWPAGTDSAGQWRWVGSAGHLQALEWFHNGPSWRAQINAQAR